MNVEKLKIMKDPTKKAKSNRLFIAVILGVLAGIPPLVTDFYLPALPQMTTDLSANASLVQLTLTACLLGMALGQIVIGPYSDVLGRRIPLIASLLIFVVATFLCPFSPSIWVLIVLRFIQGLAGAGGVVLSRAIARDLFSGKELTKFFSLLMIINGIAPILSPVAGGQLMKITDWKGIFLILAIFSVIILFVTIFGLKETLSNENRIESNFKTTFGNFWKLLKEKKFMGYTLTQGLIFASFFGYLSASPFVLQDIFGLSAQAYSFCFAINGLGIIIGTRIAGKLNYKYGETKILIFGLGLSFIASVILLLAVLFKGNILFVLVPLFVVVSCMGIISMTTNSLAMETQSKSAGSASALLGLTPFILGAMTAPLVGISGSDTAMPMAIVIAVCNIGALICYKKLVK